MKRLALVFPILSLACGGADVVLGADDGGDSGSSADVLVGTDAPVADVATTDAPSDASTSDVTTTFDPLSVSGLVLWLEGSSGVTQNNNAVSAWADKTSNHNDATQPTAAVQPTYVASAIHSLPAIHFDKDAQGVSTGGNELSIADSTSMQWGTGDFYVVVVARFDNTVADGAERGVGLLYSKNTGGNDFPGVFITANIAGGIMTPTNGFAASTSFAANGYVAVTTLYNDDVARTFAAQRVGSTLDLRINGASVGTASSAGNDISSVGIAASIGGLANGAGVRLDGDIAEILAVKGTLSAGDRTSIEQYLKNKYAL